MASIRDDFGRYKDKDGKAVMNEGQFNKACSLMKDHEITGQLVKKYKYRSERKELLKADEPLKKLRKEFDEKNKELIAVRKREDAKLLGENAAGLSYEDYKKACADKIRQDDAAEKESRQEKIRLKKQQLKDDEQMDREYLGYLERITSAKKITPERRIELLADYYISGNGQKPVPEEDLQQVQEAVNKKQQQGNAMQM